MKNLNKVKNDRGFSLAWVIGIVVVTSIISAITAGVIVYNNNKLSYDTTYGDLSNDKDLNEFLSVYANILSSYYEDVDTGALLDQAIAGMMDYLGDDYSTYLDDETTAELFESLSGEYQGIGVSINNIDKAYLRRFSFAVNFSKPNLKTRIEMWQKSLKAHHLPSDKKTAEEFAVQYQLSPSFIATAVKAAKLADGGLPEVKQSLTAMQKAYNNGRYTPPKPKTPIEFNPQLLNTDTDLSLLAQRIKQLSQRNFSLCLYGASGTGKSAYGEYLAQTLEMPVIKKKCSDLLSMWVGGTEQNIADSFNEGRENQAVLIFDEADSFLQDRSSAVRSWEITQVNEMLTQMESYPYPFICTTNLMDSLDKASLRRFTFKVGYNYMTSEQSSKAFKHFFNFSNVDLSYLNSLAPGDFVVVRQKAEILGLLDNKAELIKMLEAEQLNKAPFQHKIGFL